MAELNKLDFEGKFNSSSVGLFKNNTTGQITAERARTLVEDVADSFYNKVDDFGFTTRESGRASSTELMFDKNVIQMDTLVQTGPMTITVNESSSISDQESVIITKIQSNGVDSITVQYDPAPYFNNFTQGEILPEGTYKVFILKDLIGEITFSVVKPSIEEQSLAPLATPANFTAVPGTDPETEMDLSWTAVPNVSSYEIYVSETGGGGPWGSAIATPAAGATTYTHTGRTPNTTYHYRIRAIGDGVTFANSNYAITAGTTSDSGDTTDPTFISSPADTDTNIVVNKVVVITSDEALRDADGVTEITNANILDYLTAVNSTAGAQSITATIDATKKIITITPNVVFTENDDITITLSGIEDMNGNEPASFVFTFTTSNYSEMSGNHLSLGTQIDSFITGADVEWETEVELRNLLLLSGQKGMFQKHAFGDETYSMYLEGNDAYFKYYRRTGGVLVARSIIWPNAFSGFNTGKIGFKYDGSLDTNDGLDRPKLFIDDVEVTAGKAIAQADFAFPFDTAPEPSPFMLRGPAFREARNFKVKTNGGATTVVNIPIVRTGIDVSGNDFHGTWI